MAALFRDLPDGDPPEPPHRRALRLHARRPAATASPTTRCRRARRRSATCARSPTRARASAAARSRRASARQLEHELALIGKLDLAGYFLIVWDIVRFCRERGILCQGRGSAANTAVCYALGITAVDAVGMELLFERFLSEERGEWPDIDLDLPRGDHREEVIQYVYRRYGERGAGMTATVITYRTRSAVREAGKALGFSLAQVDRLAKLLRAHGWSRPARRAGRAAAHRRRRSRRRRASRCWSSSCGRSRACRATSASTPAAW